MSAASDIQAAVMALLGQPGALRVPVPLVQQRPKDISSEIVAAAALGNGLCAYVYPVLPSRVEEDTPFVFVDEGEVRVRILERPAVNNTGTNAFQLADDVAAALHWAPKAPSSALDSLLTHPLQIRGQQSVADEETRMVDVTFAATYRISGETAAVVPFQGDFTSAAEGLQACFAAQLSGSIPSGVPIIQQRDHDLGSAIEAAGNPVKIEILPPNPAKALEGVPFVFFNEYQVRVKVTEYPQLNEGPDVYDLTEAVMAALHWQPFGDFLAHPLQLAARPVDLRDNLDRRESTITFHAVLGFAPES